MYPLDLSATAADADKIAAAVHAFMDGGYEHQVRGWEGGRGSQRACCVYACGVLLTEGATRASRLCVGGACAKDTSAASAKCCAGDSLRTVSPSPAVWACRHTPALSHQVPHAVPKEASWLDMIMEASESLRVSPTPMLWAGIICLTIGFLLFLVSA